MLYIFSDQQQIFIKITNAITRFLKLQGYKNLLGFNQICLEFEG